MHKKQKFYSVDVLNGFIYNRDGRSEPDYSKSKYLKDYKETSYSETSITEVSRLFNLDTLAIFYKSLTVTIIINIILILFKKKINRRVLLLVYLFDIFTYIMIYIVLPKILFAVFVISHAYFFFFYFLIAKGCIYFIKKYWNTFDFSKDSFMYDIKDVFVDIIKNFNFHFLNFCIFFFLISVSIIHNFFFSLGITFCYFDLIFFFFIFLIFYFCVCLIIYIFKNNKKK